MTELKWYHGFLPDTTTSEGM